MKTLFIPAKSKLVFDKTKLNSFEKELPNAIAIAYSIQFKEFAEQLKFFLSQTKKVTKFVQVLGCTRPNFSNNEAVLFVGSGKFHAIAIAFESKLLVFVLENNKLTKVSKEEVEDLQKKQKAAYVKYLHANKVGIIVSTKPGQENLKKAIAFKKNLKNKKSYLFLSNNINSNEFENFEIDSWVNTACPRMDMNNAAALVNLGDLISK